MPALKPRPMLDKSNEHCRELALVAYTEDEETVLVNLLIKKMLVNPDQPYNYIQLGMGLRKVRIQSATDYNVRKAFRHLAEHGVVEALDGKLFRLTPEFRELILEVVIKNAKNRPKRQGL